MIVEQNNNDMGTAIRNMVMDGIESVTLLQTNEIVETRERVPSTIQRHGTIQTHVEGVPNKVSTRSKTKLVSSTSWSDEMESRDAINSHRFQLL